MPSAPKDELRPGRPEAAPRPRSNAGHQRLRRQREVRPALDDDVIGDPPDEAEARHVRVAVAVEVRVVAADGEHELAGVRPLPPDHEGEAAGQANVRVEQPRVVGELRLDPEHALLGREARDQAELDRHERDLRPRQRHAGQAEQGDLQAVADLDRDDDDAVDEGEAVERDAGGEPERAVRDREGVAERDQLGHRVVARARARVERLDERVLVEAREVGRDDEGAVDAEAAADAGEEERGRPADRPVDRAEGEERRELLAVVRRPGRSRRRPRCRRRRSGPSACRGTASCRRCRTCAGRPAASGRPCRR